LHNFSLICEARIHLGKRSIIKHAMEDFSQKVIERSKPQA